MREDHSSSHQHLSLSYVVVIATLRVYGNTLIYVIRVRCYIVRLTSRPPSSMASSVCRSSALLTSSTQHVHCSALAGKEQLFEAVLWSSVEVCLVLSACVMSGSNSEDWRRAECAGEGE